MYGQSSGSVFIYCIVQKAVLLTKKIEGFTPASHHCGEEYNKITGCGYAHAANLEVDRSQAVVNLFGFAAYGSKELEESEAKAEDSSINNSMMPSIPLEYEAEVSKLLMLVERL